MLISTHIPVGSNPLKHKAGLLTYPFYHAFPISISGKECDKQTPDGVGFTATGIVPDSHWIPFSPIVMLITFGSFSIANIQIILI
jgi:hypothetical protein